MSASYMDWRDPTKQFIVRQSEVLGFAQSRHQPGNRNGLAVLGPGRAIHDCPLYGVLQVGLGKCCFLHRNMVGINSRMCGLQMRKIVSVSGAGAEPSVDIWCSKIEQTNKKTI